MNQENLPRIFYFHYIGSSVSLKIKYKTFGIIAVNTDVYPTNIGTEGAVCFNGRGVMGENICFPLKGFYLGTREQIL